MSTTAVTPAAPAAAPAKSSNENSQIMPSDKQYRLTGAMPSSDDASAASHSAESTDDESTTETEQTATGAGDGTEGEATSEATAAGEKATQEQPAKPAKTPQTSESRWAKLSRENKELRERLAKVESRTEAQPAARENKQDSQPAAATTTKPAARPEPQIDDVDPKTGQKKYADYDAYAKDLRAWDREDVLRQLEAKTEKQTQEQAAAAAHETIVKHWQGKVTEARKVHADFDEVALNPKLDIRKGSVLDGFTIDSDYGTEILYHFGQHPEELAPLYKLSPLKQARELTKLELKLAGDKPAGKAPAKAPAATVTQAPPPPHQTRGTGTVQKDAIAAAVEANDSEAYMREQNARVLARRKSQGK